MNSRTPLLARYQGGRSSYLTCRKRSNSSTALSKLAYHTTKQSTLKPLTDASETDLNSDEPIDDLGVPKYLTTLPVYKHQFHTDLKCKDIPPLPPVLTKESLPNFIEKCNECRILVDFTDNDADLQAKSQKTNYLREIISALSTPDLMNVISEQAIDAFFEMLYTNLDRPVPPVAKKYLVFDDEPLIIEINWPHLSLVYQALLQYQTANPGDARWHNIVHHLFNLLQSADPNEREQIIKFFEAYCDQFPDKENEVLIEMSYDLIQYREGDIYPFPVAPILKFYTSRFKLQTKMTETMQVIWEKSCIPLISCHHVATIYHPLTQVCDVLAPLDDSLAKNALRVALRHWPESRPAKQINYIFMLNFLVEKLSMADFEQMCQPLFRLYAKCAQTAHAKVVETSFHIWSNVKIIQMIMDNTRAIFPIVYPVFNKVMKEHWKNGTQDAALNALKAMHDLDPFMFDELAQAQKKGTAPKVDDNSGALHKNWAHIARAAAKIDKNVNLARVLADIQMKFARPVIAEASHGRAASPSNRPKIVTPVSGSASAVKF